jgi:hypothetical protein
VKNAKATKEKNSSSKEDVVVEISESMAKRVDPNRPNPVSRPGDQNGKSKHSSPKKNENRPPKKDPAVEHGVDQTIKSNPDMYYGKSSEDIRDNEQEGINMLLNPNKVFLISLLALLVLGMFYSFLVTAFNRLVLAKLG